MKDTTDLCSMNDGELLIKRATLLWGPRGWLRGWLRWWVRGWSRRIWIRRQRSQPRKWTHYSAGSSLSIGDWSRTFSLVINCARFDSNQIKSGTLTYKPLTTQSHRSCHCFAFCEVLVHRKGPRCVDSRSQSCWGQIPSKPIGECLRKKSTWGAILGDANAEFPRPKRGS